MMLPFVCSNRDFPLGGMQLNSGSRAFCPCSIVSKQTVSLFVVAEIKPFVSLCVTAEIKPLVEGNLVNALGGCCGSRPDHIAAIVKMAKPFPPRERHGVEPLMR